MNHEIFWQALSAMGTMLAVFVSLYLAKQNKRPIKKLRIYEQFVQEYHDCFKIKKIVTIENLGNTPIIINEYGVGVKKSIVLDRSINKYLVKPYELILIKAGDAILIEYTHSYKHKFQKDVIYTPEYKLFERSKFKARDTAGTTYK